MAFRVVFSDNAANDLLSIVEFIAKDNEAKALAFVDGLQTRIRAKLATFPLLVPKSAPIDTWSSTITSRSTGSTSTRRTLSSWLSPKDIETGARSWVNSPAHTPYDGSAKPFTIGLKPLDPATWIEIDDHLEAYLAEKERHFAERPALVFAEEAQTRDAQQEALELLVSHLAAHHADSHAIDTAAVTIGAHRHVALDSAEPPLKTASRLVQEDLVLMRRGERGWRLAAASLCFPSSWSLAEKFGHPIEDIHTPVPGFGRGTRTALLINRIFDNLKPGQPVERMNWSLQADDALHKPMSSFQRNERAAARPARFACDDPSAGAFIRVERQTLRRLPASGDILFTIRIHLDRCACCKRIPTVPGWPRPSPRNCARSTRINSTTRV